MKFDNIVVHITEKSQHDFIKINLKEFRLCDLYGEYFRGDDTYCSLNYFKRYNAPNNKPHEIYEFEEFVNKFINKNKEIAYECW